MLFHLSIAAYDPRHVAEVIAELWASAEAKAFYFPPVGEGSWLVLAADDRRSGMEIYPLGTVLRQTEGDADAHGERTVPTEFTATHAAIATELDADAVLAIARREGWPAKYRKRGGMFGVIELWVEGRQMLEVLTPEMQAEYRASMTHDNWRAALASAVPA